MSKRKYWSLAERTAYVEDFLASNQARAVWCQDHGIAYNTFSRWLMKYNESSQSSDSRFIELKPKAKKTCGKSISNEKNEVLVEIGNCKIHIPVAHAATIVATVIKEANGSV